MTKIQDLEKIARRSNSYQLSSRKTTAGKDLAMGLPGCIAGVLFSTGQEAADPVKEEKKLGAIFNDLYG